MPELPYVEVRPNVAFKGDRPFGVTGASSARVIIAGVTAHLYIMEVVGRSAIATDQNTTMSRHGRGDNCRGVTALFRFIARAR